MSIWQCMGCGETFGEQRTSHGIAGHGCDGTDRDCARRCPVEIECGPIELVEETPPPKKPAENWEI